MAAEIIKRGGEIRTEQNLLAINTDGKKITSIVSGDVNSNTQTEIACDYLFSSMPVKELINKLNHNVPADVKAVADGLIYRDFITVGLLVEKLLITDSDKSAKLIKDNWIYVHEPDVLVGRIQIFNNWSPYMVQDNTKVWLGMEYFCNTTGEIWQKSESQLIELGKSELEKIGFIAPTDVIDATVIKMEKTYPAYFGSYNQFEKIREYINKITNLFLIGRNGMHKYNNQDHSMLTAMTAVDNIIAGIEDKKSIWEVNTEDDYHETK